MPASQLKTPAGVDHDYNFLSAIERERDRNQRELVQDRGVFSEKQLRELGDEKRWRKMWFGEQVRFVSASAGPRGGGGPLRGFGSDGEDDNNKSDDGEGGNPAADAAKRAHSALARRVRQRLDQANVEVVHMPLGMVRQRENTTAWNRKAQRINWCVEWIVHDEALQPPSFAPSAIANTRVRHKALETTPLYKALGNSLAWHRKGQKKEEDGEDDDDEIHLSQYARKRRRILIKEVKEEGRRSAMQDADSENWLATPYPTQNPYTGTWDLDRSAAIGSWLPDEVIDEKKNHRFYLLKPLTPLGKPKELIPLDSIETLGRALMGRTVLEYPTIYVLPPSSPLETSGEGELPEGFILGSTERRVREKKPKPEKRKAGGDKGDKLQPPNKQRAVGEDGLPIRGGRFERGRGRGRGGARGRGGGGRHQQQQRSATAEDGADTTSSDPDTSSDEEGELHSDFEEQGNMELDLQFSVPVEASGIPGGGAAASKKPTLGLLNYGSDSGDGGLDDEDDAEDLDVSSLKPDNPELVASAIQEIVGLLS